MSKLYDTYHPDGFHTLNAYLFVQNPKRYIEFLKNAFDAVEKSRTLDDSGTVIRNCILRIGDSSFMLSQASPQFAGMRTSFYLYVSDVDEVYKRALTQGAKSVFAPADMDYGDRQGGIQDLAGNYWWISTRLVKEDYAPSN